VVLVFAAHELVDFQSTIVDAPFFLFGNVIHGLKAGVIEKRIFL